MNSSDRALEKWAIRKGSFYAYLNEKRKAAPRKAQGIDKGNEHVNSE